VADANGGRASTGNRIDRVKVQSFIRHSMLFVSRGLTLLLRGATCTNPAAQGKFRVRESLAGLAALFLLGREPSVELSLSVRRPLAKINQHDWGKQGKFTKWEFATPRLLKIVHFHHSLSGPGLVCRKLEEEDNYQRK